MMPPLRVAPGVPNGCPMSPILAPHPLDLPETPHSEWADSWTNRTGPETSRPFYMGGFMDEPDRPGNLMSLSHRSLTTNRTGSETSRLFIWADHWTNRTASPWLHGRQGRQVTGLRWVKAAHRTGSTVTHKRTEARAPRGSSAFEGACSADRGVEVQRPRFPSWDRRPTSCSVTDSWEMARRMSSTSQSKPLSTCSARKDQTKLDSTGHMSSGPR